MLIAICYIMSSVFASTEYYQNAATVMIKRGSMPSLTTSKSSSTTTTSASSVNTSSVSSNSTTINGYNTTTSSQITSSSTYNATFTPIVPSTNGNKYMQTHTYPNGTVFIAVGSVLGSLALASAVVWITLAAKAWQSARREYKLQAMEHKYQTDPFLFYSNDDYASYSDTDGSDISEHVLKTKHSKRPSIYTLGSTSTVDLLQKFNQDQSEAPRLNANRTSMFISPTEIMQNQANNKSFLTQGDSSVEHSAVNTPTQPFSLFGTPKLFSEPQQGEPSDRKRFRPPSVHLEQMLDNDTEEDDDEHEEYGHRL